jgi:hypothetical protein
LTKDGFAALKLTTIGPFPPPTRNSRGTTIRFNTVSSVWSKSKRGS